CPRLVDADDSGSRSPRWTRQEQPTRLSSVARWCARRSLAGGVAREFEPTAQSIRNWVAQSARDAGRGDGISGCLRAHPSRLASLISQQTVEEQSALIAARSCANNCRI